MKHPGMCTAAVIGKVILLAACLPQIAPSQSSVRAVPSMIVRLGRVIDSSLSVDAVAAKVKMLSPVPR
jgi:hypothetical protein